MNATGYALSLTPARPQERGLPTAAAELFPSEDGRASHKTPLSRRGGTSYEVDPESSCGLFRTISWNKLSGQANISWAGLSHTHTRPRTWSKKGDSDHYTVAVG